MGEGFAGCTGRAGLAALGLTMLSACALPLNYQASRHPYALASDASAPELALLEHRLYREFANIKGDVTVRRAAFGKRKRSFPGSGGRAADDPSLPAARAVRAVPD